ncbi:MAG: ABC transporter substrate-binding protein [Bacteroidia bacterium]|nr:ABC transporter substrate-binding protein [Bacteroidia bacterium]MCX7652130.1 ABC transporter substrate-binding protein [Bacteroidia bacterium]MDW8416921.1 ABC transporter substrate-binding protein [Bacteroidia bacterium]
MRYLCVSLAFFWFGCSGSREKEGSKYVSDQTTPTRGDWVITFTLSDPENLNPTNSTSADAQYIQSYIYLSLLSVDPRDTNYPYVPAIAAALPEVSPDGMRYTFEIHPAARWDNGEPITAKDVEFSFKVIKNPLVDCPQLRPYYEFVEDVSIDPKNPRRFTVITNRKYMLALSSIGTMFILPRYIYDPENLLDKYSIRQLNKEADRLRNDPNIRRFAERYNAMQREPKDIVGAGPYVLEEWVTGQQIVLRRKPTWWGDTLKGVAYEAYPDKVVYRIINDPNTAITALKAQKIDVMNGIPAKDFMELKKNASFLEHFRLETPPSFAYSYIGLNMRPQGRRPIFTDVRVRRALAHLVDVDMIIKKFSYGLAQRVTGPLYPMHKGAYNDTLRPIPYDPQKAAQLLDEAGWKDKDGDGVREKDIDGKRIPLEFDIYVNAGNEVRLQIAQIIKQEAEKVGMRVNIVPLEWAVFLERMKKHDFDCYIGAWIGSHNPQDLKQIWHSQSWAEGGSNYVGFGNAQTDAIIEATRSELDQARRDSLYRIFHRLVYDEQPYIFLSSPLERIAIHRRFRNAYVSAIRPGYFPSGFWTPKNLIRYGKSSTAQ